MNDSSTIVFNTAATEKQFSEGVKLFVEYAASLDIDLAFQGFADELASIHLQYNIPFGALVIAYYNGNAIGCAGVRRIDNETAELKRMFVQPKFRGYQAGKRLLALAIDLAKELGYQKLRLDTVPSMLPAIKLYHAHGFVEIPPYRFNPFPGAIYMEKTLS